MYLCLLPCADPISTAMLQGKKTGGYDVIESMNTPDFALVDDNNIPKYYAVIQTDAFLSKQLEDGSWVSSLSSAMWSRIENYCARFGVRRLSVFTYPTPLLGLDVMDPNPFAGQQVRACFMHACACACAEPWYSLPCSKCT
jgi:hypothetical protein